MEPDALSGSDFFDPIKFIGLNADGSVWMGFGAQARGRISVWNNWNFGETGDADSDDAFFESRLMAHLDLHLGDHVRVFAQAKSSLASDVDLPGGTSANRVDKIALQNGFVDLTVPGFDAARVTLRTGRQEMLFGRERLVSPFDWNNVRRSFDGVSLIGDAGSWSARSFWVRPVRVRKDHFNDHRSGDMFYGINATGSLPGTDVGVELLGLGLERKDVSVNGTHGDEDRYTLGLRAWGDWGRLDFEGEGALQVGELGSSDILAGMASLEVGTWLIDVPMTPRFYLGFDFASGDDHAGGDVETFAPPFPNGHIFLGIADQVGRSNVIATSGGATFRPLAGLELDLSCYSFWRAERNDALYAASGNVLRPGGATDPRHVGVEIDLLLTYRYDPHTTLGAGYGHFFPGAFIRDSGSASDLDTFYFWLRFAL